MQITKMFSVLSHIFLRIEHGRNRMTPIHSARIEWLAGLGSPAGSASSQDHCLSLKFLEMKQEHKNDEHGGPQTKKEYLKDSSIRYFAETY